jgi:hypothetical protein
MTNAQGTTAFSTYIDVGLPERVSNFRGVPTRIIVNDNSSKWNAAVKERLEVLIRLIPGWDGYGALPVSFENANFALRILERICDEDSPAPQIVPGTQGDLQIEWHTLQGDIELHIKAPNDVHAWRAMQNADPDGEDLDLTNDFAAIAHWVKEIVEPTIGASAAAL